MPAFKGTSNVYFARLLNLPVFGSMAHEWMQYHQIFGIEQFQEFALNGWSDTFKGKCGIALTDTINMDSFLKEFDGKLARIYDGCRHDSGDPFIWGEKLLSHYMELGIDPRFKTLVFSDGLDFNTIKDIQEAFAHRVRVSFGIGTKLMNRSIDPPSIVIKMVSAEGQPVAKISDEPFKTVCEDLNYLKEVKERLNVI